MQPSKTSRTLINIAPDLVQFTAYECGEQQIRCKVSRHTGKRGPRRFHEAAKWGVFVTAADNWTKR